MATIAELASKGVGGGMGAMGRNPRQFVTGGNGLTYSSPSAHAMANPHVAAQFQQHINNMSANPALAGVDPSRFGLGGSKPTYNGNLSGSLGMDPNAGAQDFNGTPGFNMPLWTGDTTNFGQTGGFYVPGTDYGPGTQAAINGYRANQMTNMGMINGGTIFGPNGLPMYSGGKLIGQVGGY